jgi:fermentation-respiration switch protein FrsA (DUF1100 family)
VGAKVWRMLWSILLIVVAGYVCLAIFLMAFQSHYVYFPERGIVATPDAIGLPYETVDFEAADGVRLSGWFIPAENPRGTLLFFHGNAGNISHRLESIEVFNRLHLNTLIFDYRGFGQSGGKITEQGTYLDAEAAWRYLTEERDIDAAEIVVFGRSLGGTIAAWLAQHHPPKALILESTFTSIPDIGADVYPYLPVRLMSRYSYDAAGYLRRANCPVLIIHSRNDEIIPFRHGQRLFEAANEPKEFLEIGGSHNEGFITSAKRYQEGLDSFISTYLRDETLDGTALADSTE